MKANKISVWYDSTSEKHGWIVSEDDHDGGTATLAVLPTHDAAIDRAQQESTRRNLPIVECDTWGNETPI